MHSAGLTTADQAKADGRWDRAYAGAATIEVPSDLAAALKANPAAKATFDGLNGANRYAVLYRVTTPKRPETRRKHLERAIDHLVERAILRPGKPH